MRRGLPAAAVFAVMALLLAAGTPAGADHGVEVGKVAPVIAEAGDDVRLSVTIVNTGNETDRLTIELNLSSLGITDLPHLRLTPSVMPGSSRIVVFPLYLPEETPTASYILPVTVTSQNALDEGINVTAETSITLNVLPASEGSVGGSSSGADEREVRPIWRTMIFLAILLFVVIALIVLFRKRGDLEHGDDIDEMRQELSELLEWSDADGEDTGCTSETTTGPQPPPAAESPPPRAMALPPRAAPVSGLSPPTDPEVALPAAPAARAAGEAPPAAPAPDEVPPAAPAARRIGE